MMLHTIARRATMTAALVAAFATAASAANPTTIAETGSTLMYPLLERWSTQYRSVAPGVHLTVAATGSGAGMTEVLAGHVQIGASDAYMTDEQVSAHPGVLNIPLAISSQLVTYNIPGLNTSQLRLDGPTLAGIYNGTIRDWDSPAIVAMNPGLKLEHHEIAVIHRSDSSGDSFIFSQYLTFSTDSWEFGPSYGTDIAWPVFPGSIGVVGNAGAIKAAATTPYSIAYLGGSFFAQVAAARLGTALLKNQAGNFVRPTPETVRVAAAMLGARTPKDERLSLVFAPGADSYPLVNYEYAIVEAKQPNPETAAALRDFLLWAIDSGAGNAPKTLDPLHFAALPESVRALSDQQIRQIS